MYIVIHVSQTAIFRCCVMFMSNDIIIIVAFSLKGTTSENILQYSPLPITTRSHIEDYPKRWLEKI